LPFLSWLVDVTSVASIGMFIRFSVLFRYADLLLEVAYATVVCDGTGFFILLVTIYRNTNAFYSCLIDGD